MHVVNPIRSIKWLWISIFKSMWVGQLTIAGQWVLLVIAFRNHFCLLRGFSPRNLSSSPQSQLYVRSWPQPLLSNWAVDFNSSRTQEPGWGYVSGYKNPWSYSSSIEVLLWPTHPELVVLVRGPSWSLSALSTQRKLDNITYWWFISIPLSEGKK